MVKVKLARLERALEAFGGAKCQTCGGGNGVDGVPLIDMLGDRSSIVYGADGLCVRCSAAAPYTIHVTCPSLADRGPSSDLKD